MKRRLTIVIALLTLALGVLAAPPAAGLSLAETQGSLASADLKFGFKLFSKLAGDKEQNLFISPASVAFALDMTYNGAAAETQQAMAKTLEIQGLSLEEVNRANKVLRQALTNPDPKIKLSIANSLWLAQGWSLKPEFVKRNEEFYGATLKSLNFRDPRSPATINAWVTKATAGKISRIVQKIAPPLILINAIYFKGLWTRPFDQALTKDRPFTLANGRQKPRPMMSQSGEYQYFHGKNFQAVSLPYGEKGRLSLKIFLPDPNSNLKVFCRELDAANWQQWQADFKMNHGSIVLPRFKLEYKEKLKESLTALGMGVAFDKQRANFSNLCPPPGVYIDDVIHKTYVEVNEEGTEAAAATAVQMKAMAVFRPEKPFTLIVDRPFFVALDDRETGAVLFMGAIFEPK
jgi:serine protease inhibitor